MIAEGMIKSKAAQKIQLDMEIAACRKQLAQVDYDVVISGLKSKNPEMVVPDPPAPKSLPVKKKSKRFDLKVWWKENVMV